MTIFSQVQPFTRFVAVALILISFVACSRSPRDVTTRAPTPTLGTSTETDVPKSYDPTSLIEVRKFDDLPEAVKTLANNSYMTAMLDNTPTKFLVAGAGDSSVIVAYEQFGLVPSFHAQAYIYSRSQWISGRQWDIGAEITNLKDLISATNSIP